MKRFPDRRQRTIARTAEVAGRGFLTGKIVQLRFRPAPVGTGVVFVRTDLGPDATVRAIVGNVTGTNRRTTLGHAPIQVGLVEHVMAALTGLKIDNCLVEVDAPEPPGLDGSASKFVEILRQAGVTAQDGNRPRWTVTEPLCVRNKGATLTLHPADEPTLTISYFLDYGVKSPIARQTHTQTIDLGTFPSRLACTRTFLLEEEAVALRQQGLGSQTKMTDLLIFGKNGPIDNTLRFADEPARHKALDILGDLALVGVDLCGHVVAYRSGHPLNFELATQLHRQLHRQSRPCLRAA